MCKINMGLFFNKSGLTLVLLSLLSLPLKAGADSALKTESIKQCQYQGNSNNHVIEPDGRSLNSVSARFNEKRLQALNLLSEGKKSELLRFLTLWLSETSRDHERAEIYNLLSRVLHIFSDYEGSLKYAMAAIESNGVSPKTVFLAQKRAATASFILGKFKFSQKILEQLKNDHGALQAFDYRRLGITYVATRDYKAAICAFNAALHSYEADASLTDALLPKLYYLHRLADDGAGAKAIVNEARARKIGLSRKAISDEKFEKFLFFYAKSQLEWHLEPKIKTMKYGDKTKLQKKPPTTKRVVPIYPEAFDGLDFRAFVSLRYDINERGEVENIEVLFSPAGKGFSQPAVAALKQWPYEVAGHETSLPVKGARIVFDFTPKKVP